MESLTENHEENKYLHLTKDEWLHLGRANEWITSAEYIDALIKDDPPGEMSTLIELRA